MKPTQHIPVLADEVIDGLQLQPGMIIVDATLGLGGHTKLIFDDIQPGGRVVAFDRDDRNVALAQERLPQTDQIHVVHDSFANLAQHVSEQIDGALFDLGYSSVHVDDPQRGFSFQQEGPLDMRYDTAQELTAEMIVNSWSKDDLADAFRKLAEERRAPQIAKAIFEARRQKRITTTVQLADIVAGVVRRTGKIHPATKVFQALRIAVNDEFGEIEKGLHAAVDALKPGGRLAVITFHSIEDRLVKQLITSRADLTKVTKNVIQATYQERQQNPRSRSAKLRLAAKTEV